MRKMITILWTLTLGVAVCSAEIRLPQIFQSGMVLQRGTDIPVWGQAAPGETVTVSLNRKKCTATADAGGHWRVDLPAMKAGGPYVLTVNSQLSTPGSQLTLDDVWIGDVWLCSGQSNMETTLERVSPQYPDELNDFMARMQWAAEGHGNRNPRVVVNGKKGLTPIVIHAKAGKVVRLDASRSTDPDGDALSFQWWQQPEIGGAQLSIQGADQKAASIRILDDAQGKRFHVVCEVHDNGPFHLVAYRRVIIIVK